MTNNILRYKSTVINFSNVFNKPEELREVNEITTDLAALEKELKQLEKKLNL